MINLDKASTTSIDIDLLNKYVELVKVLDTHPDSDPQLIKLREEVKDKIRHDLGISHNICFTSGGTEANNLAIIGFSKKFNTPKHFITSVYEHPSVLESFKHLESLGHEVTYIKPNHHGIIEVNDVINNIRKNTVLISIMMVNNEIGAKNDIKSLVKSIKNINSRIIVMSDTVQAINYVDQETLNLLDMFVISGHKIHAFKGSGLLAFKKNVVINNILYGGHNEHSLRPGTQDLAREIILAKAIEKYACKKMTNNLDYLKEQLNKIDKITINCDSYTHVINIALNIDKTAESIKNQFLENDIIISTKSACSSISTSRSNVLLAINIDEQSIDHSIRISVDQFTSKEDIDQFINILQTKILN